MQNSSARIPQAFANYFQQNGDSQAPAKTYISATYVDVHWPWLIYPLAIALACVVNLIITIYQTRRYKLPIPFGGLLHSRSSSSSTLTNKKKTAPIESTAAGMSVTGRETAPGDGVAEEPEEEPRPAGPGKSLLSRSAAVASDSISAFQVLAKEKVVQLIRSDGRWGFGKIDSK